MINKKFELPASISIAQALVTIQHPQELWTGIMIGTVLNDNDVSDFKTLFQHCHPLIVIGVVSSSIPVKTSCLWVTLESGYVTTNISCSRVSDC